MDNVEVAQAEPEAPADVAEDALEQQTQEETETSQEQQERFTKEEWLRKERNAVSYRDKKLGRMQEKLAAAEAEKSAFMARLEALEKSVSPRKDDRPDESQFDRYDDYVAARTRYEMRQELNENLSQLTQRQQQEFHQRQREGFIAARQNALSNEIGSLVRSVPEVQSVIEENADIVFPNHLTQVFYELEPKIIATAIVNLGKEGRLEDLAEMTPIQAVATIMSAQTPIKRQVTKAPTPISAAKGSGTNSKTLQQMSARDLVKWVNESN